MSSIVKNLRLLADETRLRLLSLLQQEELTVVEIQGPRPWGSPAFPRTSRNCGRPGSCRIGAPGRTSTTSSPTTPSHRELAPILAVSATRHPRRRDTISQKALRLALKKQRDKAREYFNQLAGKARPHLHVPAAPGKASLEMLFALLPPLTICRSWRRGIGGCFHQLLARRAKKIIAVDNSEKMVEFGVRPLAKRHAVRNLEFRRLGDARRPADAPPAASMSPSSGQALHHAIEPAKRRAAAHTASSARAGRIAIIDLLAHRFEHWRREFLRRSTARLLRDATSAIPRRRRVPRLRSPTSSPARRKTRNGRPCSPPASNEPPLRVMKLTRDRMSSSPPSSRARPPESPSNTSASNTACSAPPPAVATPAKSKR